ncbi:MAG: EamA family transporter [Ktedonobacteraceae bacterium]
MCIAAWQRVYIRPAAGSLTNTTAASFSLTWAGGGLAAAVGLLETIGLLLYSEATHIAATSIVAAISSCFALIPLVFGMTVFHERPTKQQVVGVCMVITGLMLLALT